MSPPQERRPWSSPTPPTPRASPGRSVSVQSRPVHFVRRAVDAIEFVVRGSRLVYVRPSAFNRYRMRLCRYYNNIIPSDGAFDFQCRRNIPHGNRFNPLVGKGKIVV